MRRLFGAIAVGFAFSAAFHVAALFVPSLAGDSPAWRHALFAAVNALVAVGIVRRPRGFVFAFALLTAQQLLSHGRDLITVWQTAHRVDIASVIVLVSMPAILVLLIRDHRAISAK